MCCFLLVILHVCYFNIQSSSSSSSISIIIIIIIIIVMFLECVPSFWSSSPSTQSCPPHTGLSLRMEKSKLRFDWNCHHHNYLHCHHQSSTLSPLLSSKNIGITKWYHQHQDHCRHPDDNLLLQPDSIYFLRQPHDFVAFIHQVGLDT